MRFRHFFLLYLNMHKRCKRLSLVTIWTKFPWLFMVLFRSGPLQESLLFTNNYQRRRKLATDQLCTFQRSPIVFRLTGWLPWVASVFINEIYSKLPCDYSPVCQDLLINFFYNSTKLSIIQQQSWPGRSAAVIFKLFIHSFL